ncbi:MAG: primosomal protein N', partial [Gammaproteobacteria bacterium]|nr:primosomal protein N' [Gammaproteobacteria bacterium]
TPLRAPGVFIVDEEHDPSFKQQEGFRYSARDVAIMRAHRSRVPIALGSATPSLESLHHARRGRYRHLTLPERAGNAAHPRIDVLDLRRQPLQEGLSPTLLRVMDEHIARGEQVLLFLNRRGYAPTLICHDCGWWAECRRCDAHLTFHRGRQRLICHHCGAERPLDRHCPSCGSADLRALGLGTERIEQALRERYAGVGIVRIDRDSTRRKGALQSLLDSVHAGEARILIGTQMLTKGHHFPEVTLVGVLDADQGLFGADFRAGERMAQLIVQVAGRAGRADKPGRVLIQTHHPDHPLLRTLITQGYHAFAAAAMDERRAAGWPPYSSLALLRAEAAAPQAPQDFLTQARAAAQQAGVNGVQVLGPVPAPLERRAGRYRAHLLLQAAQRADLQRLLETWVTQLETLKAARRVRWSLDVDPVEML